MSEIAILQRSLSKAASSVEEHSDKQDGTGDDVALPEEQTLNLDRLRVEIETLRTKTTILCLEHHMRKIALLLLFIFMSAWSGLIFLTYWLCDLSDAVAITLFTTTLGQVLGLTTIALRWLFPKR